MDRRILYSFGTTWINDRLLIFGWSIPFIVSFRQKWIANGHFSFCFLIKDRKLTCLCVSTWTRMNYRSTSDPFVSIFDGIRRNIKETSKLRLKWNILGFPFQVSWAMKELVWALKMTPSIPRLLHYDITFYDYDVNTQDSDGFDLHCCDLILVRILILIPHTKTHDKQLLALLPCCSRRQMHLWERLP